MATQVRYTTSTTMAAEDRYFRMATLYIRFVRPYSAAAADCLKQIQTRFGSQAAYAAARDLTMVRLEAERTGQVSLPEEGWLVQAFPQVLPLLKEAVAAFKVDWNRRNSA